MFIQNTPAPASVRRGRGGGFSIQPLWRTEERGKGRLRKGIERKRVSGDGDGGDLHVRGQVGQFGRLGLLRRGGWMVLVLCHSDGV